MISNLEAIPRQTTDKVWEYNKGISKISEIHISCTFLKEVPGRCLSAGCIQGTEYLGQK
jgi:hypothetical protein